MKKFPIVERSDWPMLLFWTLLFTALTVIGFMKDFAGTYLLGVIPTTICLTSLICALSIDKAPESCYVVTRKDQVMRVFYEEEDAKKYVRVISQTLSDDKYLIQEKKII